MARPSFVSHALVPTFCVSAAAIGLALTSGDPLEAGITPEQAAERLHRLQYINLFGGALAGAIVGAYLVRR